MPSPRATGSEHASHDELLIARFAGDDLDPRERVTAADLVADCPDCARLAADIVAISRAVATERAPTRRRDYRIGPEQARELRGSPIRRLVRRLTLPTDGGALRPLATGALSIGLALVLVGSVVPRPSEVAAPAPAAQRQVEPAGSVDVRAASEKVGGPPASEPEEADTSGGAASMTMEMSAMDAAEPEAVARSAEQGLLATSPAPPRARLTDSPGDAARDAAADDGASEEAAAPAAFTDDPAAGLRIDEVAVTDELAVGSDDAALDLDPATSGLDLGAIVVVIGIAMVAIGLFLVLLLILSRRRAPAS